MSKKFQAFFIQVLLALLALPSPCEGFRVGDGAMSLFNGRLGESERETVRSGGTLLRSVSSMKKLCVRNEGMPSLVIGPMSKKVRSGFIAEIINFRPYEGNEDLIERINDAMSDFLAYTEIPYWSEHAQKWFPLYDSAEVLSVTTEGDVTTIDEMLEIDMFGKFRSRITVENYGTHFIYRLKNLDKLKYHGWLPVIDREELCSVIAVFRIDDCWMIYAIGGANALRIPFVKGRAEPAFIGRVKAFADYTFRKIDRTGEAAESALDRKDATNQ